MSVLVIGESCNDVYYYGNAKRLAPEAPVPVFQTTDIKNAGGMSQNVKANLEALQVSTSIHTNSNWRDIKKKRYVDWATNQMLLRVDSNDDSYEQSHLEDIYWNEYEAVIISDYDKGFLSTTDIQHICNRHPRVFVDTKKVLGDWAANAFIIKINNIEYANTKHTIDDHLYSKLIITMGSYGCKYLDQHFPVSNVGVKDACGAGDTFIAALVSDFLKTDNMNSAIEFANKCATQVIQKRGTSTVNLEEL